MADHILQEIDAALRADRAAELWRKYRGTLFAIVIAIIVGTAASSVWHSMRNAEGGEVLSKLSDGEMLLSAGKADEAAQAFGAIAADASGAFKDLALVWQARALVVANKKDEAIAALKAASANGGSVWTDVACLRLAGLDEQAAAPCLGAKSPSPLAATRGEWAAAQLWAKGDVAAASAVQALIDDKNTTADARERLTQWLAVMQAQAGKKA